jgi:hypothetical protein
MTVTLWLNVEKRISESRKLIKKKSEVSVFYNIRIIGSGNCRYAFESFKVDLVKPEAGIPRAEGLCDIVVSAGLKAEDPVDVSMIMGRLMSRSNKGNGCCSP